LRGYDIAIAALAIDAPRKWLDNLLSHHTIAEVQPGRQGQARRVSYGALMRLAVIRQLHAQLGIGVGDAVRLSETLVASGHAHVLALGQLTLSVDVDALRHSLDQRLATALESAPSPRRGRPPRK
jgi:hypothetical protein